MDIKKALIIGLGVSGRSAAAYLLDRGAAVAGVDSNRHTLETNAEIGKLRERGLATFTEAELLAESAPVPLAAFDCVVVSPGVPVQNTVYREATRLGIEVIGEIELACRQLTQPLIGITGTNGKTTVSLLVGHVLNRSGRPAKVVGNAGVPLTAEVKKGDSAILVCELSSYQLETMRTRVIDCAALLNITPDHLDRYPSMEDYAKAKIAIASCLKPGGTLYVEQAAYQRYAPHFNGFLPKTYGYSPSCNVYTDGNKIFFKEGLELLLPKIYRGKSCHDVENIMAAFALCSEQGVRPDEFIHALESFKKPPHRIEFVTALKGVSFYDDSKGTNPDAVIRAIESMQGNVILIAGGVDKGGGYQSWIEPFAGKVKAVYAIGQAKGIIAKEIGHAFQVHLCDTLENAVKEAFSIARQGENVLLSPGCSSFDMFENYEHRGNAFKQIVHELDT